MTTSCLDPAWSLCLALGLVLGTAIVSGSAEPPPAPKTDPALDEVASSAKQELKKKHGDGEAERIGRGVDQVRRYWRKEDGDAKAFKEFVLAEFVPAGKLDATFQRFEFALERIGGYTTSLTRDLRKGVDLEIGELLPLDQRLSAYDPGAHLSEDMFSSKLAMVALLNFPLSTLEERLAKGTTWSRREWAERRLAQRFSARVPADVNARITAAYSEAGTYISAYNVYMHHVLTPDGKRLFPKGLRLLSHWNLRDELKARYADPEGLAKQRLIATVMEKIVRQEIPAAVVNNPLLDWTPATGAVTVSPVKDADVPPTAKGEALREREADERYRQWKSIFDAERLGDPYHPDNPTFIDRRFNRDREIPEKEVTALLEAVLTSPLSARVAKVVEKRLGRRLEPFDIWYAGFKPRAKHTEAELDTQTKRRYPTPAAYAADMPRLFTQLGFSEEKARFLADHIEVDPARGSGHAFGAARRDDKAHLRTRVGADGMDYKGYNIAVHEMGHNVEQVFSTTTIDHTLLMGVPNTAFTEALAFVFQNRDLELLGVSGPDPQAQDMKALEDFWAAREIAGVALVDMGAWRWLYAHPEASPTEFRQAVVALSQDIWNRHYAPLLGAKDVALLGIYSHMVDSGLYVPDYPIGHLIAFQVEEHFRKTPDRFGAEFERICQLGSITPDAWMRQAVGAPLSAQPLLEAAKRTLKTQEK